MEVVDSSVLIPLAKISKLSLLEKFFKKIFITKEIYKEIQEGKAGREEIEESLNKWIFIKKPKNLQKIKETEEVGKADYSIINLSKENKEILLSNDYALISLAKSKGTECWWMTTFIIKCIKKNLINKEQAEQILLNLIRVGMRLDNLVYAEIIDKIKAL